MSGLRTRIAACLAASVVSLSLLTVGTPGSAAAVEPGTPLPPAPPGTVANGVAYVGDTVFASFRPAESITANGLVYRTPADGSGSWVPVTAPGSVVPLSVPTDKLVARGAAIVLPAAADDPTTPCADYRLITPTAERALESCFSAPVLGHGGELVARRANSGTSNSWAVERVDSGVQVMTRTYRPAIDGDVVWEAEGPYVAAADVSAQTFKTKLMPPECAGAALVDAFGRFVLVRCNGSSVIVDASGLLTPRALPPGDWSLGDGFAYDVRSSDALAPTHRVVRVIELARDQMIKTYGWSSHNGSDNTIGRAEPEDGGAHALVMLTEIGEVQRVDLSWVRTPPAPADDTVPPIVDQVGGSPASVPATYQNGSPLTRLSFTWAAHDPGDTGALVYDVRAYHEVDGAPDTYVQYDVWKGRITPSTEYTEWAVDTTVCFQVRARDWVGNLSVGPDAGWTTPRCTHVENTPPPSTDTGVPPTTSGSTGHLLGFVDALGPLRVSYAYEAIDDVDGRSVDYDVDYRLADHAQPLGGWVSPTSWEWTTATSVTQTVAAGGEVCFRSRARDHAGNVGEYTQPSCAAVPYDDRAFRLHDGAKRVRRTGALGGTVTKMFGRHGSMTRRGEIGRHVWVRLTGGVPYACARVRFDGAHPHGCIIETVGGAEWQHFDFRRQRAGTLRIGGGMRVDAVAVIR